MAAREQRYTAKSIARELDNTSKANLKLRRASKQYIHRETPYSGGSFGSFTTNAGYVYVIEFVQHGKIIWKIGKTKTKDLSRLDDYPKSFEIVGIFKTNNRHSLEKQFIDKMHEISSVGVSHPCHGKEWFMIHHRGSIKTIKIVLFDPFSGIKKFPAERKCTHPDCASELAKIIYGNFSLSENGNLKMHCNLH